MAALVAPSRCRTIRLVAVMTAFEAGYADADLRQHAARRAIGGSSALCGAGRIIVPVAGRFGTTLDDACPACIVTAAGQPLYREVGQTA
jgi:hypothetical protein